MMCLLNTKDWTGNKMSAFATLGASNHSEKERHPNDYYATDPKAMELLLEKEQFSKNIWECACGGGHLSKVLEQHGYNVRSTDLVYRGYGETEPLDFLNAKDAFDGDIVTNPPYKYALEFVRKSLDIVKRGNKVAMFLKLQFLESKSRKELFLDSPPKTVYVCSSRIDCAINGEFETHKASAMAYAWFVWEKGFKGDPSIKWIN